MEEIPQVEVKVVVCALCGRATNKPHTVDNCPMIMYAERGDAPIRESVVGKLKKLWKLGKR